MKRLIFVPIVLLFALFLPRQEVFSQSKLQYPIRELGVCRDAKECYLYCEIPRNSPICWSYGKYRLGPQVLGVTAMTDEEKTMMRSKARQYGITFPIAALGNCSGPQECRDYCEMPENYQSCMSFAKQKGFAKEMDAEEELIQNAKTELGCASMESCRRVCESDHTRCEIFAKKHGAYKEPPQEGRLSAGEKTRLIEKAKTELGCTSMESCKSACEQNPKKCMEFSSKHGFDQNERPNQQSETPSGIRYAPRRIEDVQRERFGGDVSASSSGCRTEAECEKWCVTHPDQCPGFTEAKMHEATVRRTGDEPQRRNSPFPTYAPGGYPAPSSYPQSEAPSP